jgi:sorbitol-specific phosphotransferase system component IIBC
MDLIPERNPLVHAEHRRETFRQILLPLIIAFVLALVVVAIIIILGFGSTLDLSRLAAVSIIGMIIPSMLIALILLVVVLGLLFAISRLLGILPGYSRIVQSYFSQAQTTVSHITDQAVEPVLRLRSAWAVTHRRGKRENK